MTTFTFNGKKNTEFGLRVAEGKKITTSNLDVERVAVAGRDGELLISNNRLNSAELSFPVNFVKEKGLIATEVYRISEWLNVAGYKDLTISYDPDFIYRAAYLETFSIEETMRQFGKTTVNFVCYPVKFYKQGRTKQTLMNGATALATSTQNLSSRFVDLVTAHSQSMVARLNCEAYRTQLCLICKRTKFTLVTFQRGIRLFALQNFKCHILTMDGT